MIFSAFENRIKTLDGPRVRRISPFYFNNLCAAWSYKFVANLRLHVS